MVSTQLFPESPRSHVLILRISGRLYDYDVISCDVCRFLPVLLSQIRQDIRKRLNDRGRKSLLQLNEKFNLSAYQLVIILNATQ